jgi:hypothetical protein
VVITARITYAHAADLHVGGWTTEKPVAITSPQGGLHHVDHLAALVEQVR